MGAWNWNQAFSGVAGALDRALDQARRKVILFVHVSVAAGMLVKCEPVETAVADPFQDGGVGRFRQAWSPGRQERGRGGRHVLVEGAAVKIVELSFRVVIHTWGRCPHTSRDSMERRCPAWSFSSRRLV